MLWYLAGWLCSKYFPNISIIFQVSMFHRNIFLRQNRNIFYNFYWMQRLFLISRNIGYFPIQFGRKKYVETLENIYMLSPSFYYQPCDSLPDYHGSDLEVELTFIFPIFSKIAFILSFSEIKNYVSVIFLVNI